ncbi:MAG: 50S ribosomal protein L3 [Myxococcota bacterium]
MALGILATKVGMTQIFVQDGERLPVTVLKMQPNCVVAKRLVQRDGYNALQLGCGGIRSKLVNKPRAGQFVRARVQPTRHLQEFRVTQKQLDAYEVGASIGMELFQDVQSVDVSSVSKGKGFAGVMKRHGFAGFPASHGTHESFRGGGSIGQREQPGKVFKGKRMAGHMGNERVTTLNLRVAKLLQKEGALCVVGSVPGAKGALVRLTPSQRTPRALAHLGEVTQTKAKNPMKASKSSSGKGAGKKSSST